MTAFEFPYGRICNPTVLIFEDEGPMIVRAAFEIVVEYPPTLMDPALVIWMTDW
jgi:hypothetical protein